MTVVHRGFYDAEFDVAAYFFNPNIHPYKEWKRRFDTFCNYCTAEQIRNIYDDSFPLEDNLIMLLAAENRCLACFENRLRATAEKADELGIRYFSTTLTVSPYQDHKLIMEAGERASAESEAEFIYRDFSGSYCESIELSREAGLYRQPYCGCAMSERDRYMR